ncbi:MAG: cupin domain-containing protein [Pseudomonadota bacterium]
MEINADFDKRILVHSDTLDWLPSPMKGVMRRPLDRVGEEVARATTIVRYDPDSHFSPHVHTGGEEFLVLKGVFQDEHGDFPVGSYIRNPPGSSHTPGSDEGCIIFVKLWQFEPDDQTHVRIRLDTADFRSIAEGVQHLPLFENSSESVSIYKLEPEAMLDLETPGGAELLVVDGQITESIDTLNARDWLRVPEGSNLSAKAEENGATIWIKSGHLPHVDAQIKRLQKSA